MKVDCEIIKSVHLDPGYALLSVQNCFTCMEMFNILDVHRAERLNDVQFLLLMKNITNLGTYDTEIIFNLLDIDHSGEIEFDEFYLIYCILIASKDSNEKEFIFRHSKSIFQLIDSDGSGEISIEEFGHMGILFNFDQSAIKRIFDEFDVSGDRNLDFAEFRLFTMACIDEARAQAARSKVKAYATYHEQLLTALEPLLRRFIRTDCLPVPRDIEETTNKVRQPYIPGRRDWKLPFRSQILQQRFKENREVLRDWVIRMFGKIPCMFGFCWISCCDFCCLNHPEDEIKCEFNWHCHCKCWKCMMHILWVLCGCCFCCACCYSCGTDHRRRHKKGTGFLRKPKNKKPDIKFQDNNKQNKGTFVPEEETNSQKCDYENYDKDSKTKMNSQKKKSQGKIDPLELKKGQSVSTIRKISKTRMTMKNDDDKTKPRPTKTNIENPEVAFPDVKPDKVPSKKKRCGIL